MDLLEALPRVCTVPAVPSELAAGVGSHPHLQRALDSVGETIPVVALNESADDAATQRERRLDLGEAQAFAVADTYDGTLVTEDGPARALAPKTGVAVTGSIGVLISAVEGDRLSEVDADRWLKQWIDETDYPAPSRDLSDYL